MSPNTSPSGSSRCAPDHCLTKPPWNFKSVVVAPVDVLGRDFVSSSVSESVCVQNLFVEGLLLLGSVGALGVLFSFFRIV